MCHNITISEVVKRVNLLKQATCEDVVPVRAVAKELNIRLTDLMNYINSNPGCFRTTELYSANKKPKGLGIAAAYLTPSDNPGTDEWIEKQIESCRKTIWISKWDNYGTIEGYYVNEDIKKEIDKFQLHLWRNTHEKIEELKKLGVFYETTFYIGGFMDCSSTHCSTAINETGRKIAEENGWTIK